MQSPTKVTDDEREFQVRITSRYQIIKCTYYHEQGRAECLGLITGCTFLSDHSIVIGKNESVT